MRRLADVERVFYRSQKFFEYRKIRDTLNNKLCCRESRSRQRSRKVATRSNRTLAEQKNGATFISYEVKMMKAAFVRWEKTSDIKDQRLDHRIYRSRVFCMSVTSSTSSNRHRRNRGTRTSWQHATSASGTLPEGSRLRECACAIFSMNMMMI